MVSSVIDCSFFKYSLFSDGYLKSRSYIKEKQIIFFAKTSSNNFKFFTNILLENYVVNKDQSHNSH